MRTINNKTSDVKLREIEVFIKRRNYFEYITTHKSISIITFNIMTTHKSISIIEYFILLSDFIIRFIYS